MSPPQQEKISQNEVICEIYFIENRFILPSVSSQIRTTTVTESLTTLKGAEHAAMSLAKGSFWRPHSERTVYVNTNKI